MKPSTVAKLIAFSALYDVALAAPQSRSGASASQTTSSTLSSSTYPIATPFAGNPSSLNSSPSSSSSGTQPEQTSSITNGDMIGSKYSTGDELNLDSLVTPDPIGPAGSNEPLCRHGRLFNVQQACVDHCANGICYDSMWTPPVDYTAYEYSFAPNGNGPSGNGPSGNGPSGNSKRATSDPSPSGQDSGVEVTQYQMEVTKQQMQIWVCAACPAAQQSPVLSRIDHTSTVQPITTSATTSVSGRTASATGTNHPGSTQGGPSSSSSSTSRNGGSPTSSNGGSPTSSAGSN